MQTVEAVLQLYEDEQQCLLTTRLNQDALENFFAIVRQKVFRKIFRSCVVHSLLKPPSTSNCEPDMNRVLDLDAVSQIEPQRSSNSSSDDYTETAEPSEINLEHLSVTYFAGYLLKRCLEKFNCFSCKINFATERTLTDRSQLFILHKTYANIGLEDSSGLLAPSPDLRNIVDIALKLFERYFPRIYFEKNLRTRLLKRIRKHLPNEWLSEGQCKTHKLFIIEKLISSKISHKCKLLSGKTITLQTKVNPKLRLLQYT